MAVLIQNTRIRSQVNWGVGAWVLPWPAARAAPPPPVAPPCPWRCRWWAQNGRGGT